MKVFFNTLESFKNGAFHLRNFSLKSVRLPYQKVEGFVSFLSPIFGESRLTIIPMNSFNLFSVFKTITPAMIQSERSASMGLILAACRAG